MKNLVYSFLVAIALLVSAGCEEEKHYYVRNVDAENVPTMSTVNVNTFISDSGYTKYNIQTPLWDIYDEAREPYWKLPMGVELKQYSNSHQLESTLRCDSAIYKSQRRIWQLDGNVVMVNVHRDSFLTNQVFWDQAMRELRSDSFVHIVRSDRIIEGIGFKSNESMTRYEVLHPTGIFPVEKPGEKKEGAPSQPGTQGAPSPQPAPAPEYNEEEDDRRAPAPRRPSERSDGRGLKMHNF